MNPDGSMAVIVKSSTGGAAQAARPARNQRGLSMRNQEEENFIENAGYDDVDLPDDIPLDDLPYDDFEVAPHVTEDPQHQAREVYADNMLAADISREDDLAVQRMAEGDAEMKARFGNSRRR